MMTQNTAAAQPAQTALPAAPPPAPTADQRLAALEALLQAQSQQLARQQALLERQEQRARLRRLWLAAKVALVLVLAVWLGPKLYQAWQGYRQMLAQMDAMTAQVSALADQASGFLADAQTRIDAIAASLQTIETALAPLAEFVARLRG